MAVIQGFLGFVKHEATSKNGVNPMMIKSITEDNILTGLVAYSTMVIAKQIGLESLGLEIYDDIYPYQRSSELIRKRDSSVNESSATFSVSEQGRSHINSKNTKDFLDLAHSNSKSKSWSITIHLEYFPPSN